MGIFEMTNGAFWVIEEACTSRELRVLRKRNLCWTIFSAVKSKTFEQEQFTPVYLALATCLFSVDCFISDSLLKDDCFSVTNLQHHLVEKRENWESSNKSELLTVFFWHLLVSFCFHCWERERERSETPCHVANVLKFSYVANGIKK